MKINFETIFKRSMKSVEFSCIKFISHVRWCFSKKLRLLFVRTYHCFWIVIIIDVCHNNRFSVLWLQIYYKTMKILKCVSLKSPFRKRLWKFSTAEISATHNQFATNSFAAMCQIECCLVENEKHANEPAGKLVEMMLLFIWMLTFGLMVFYSKHVVSVAAPHYFPAFLWSSVERFETIAPKCSIDADRQLFHSYTIQYNTIHRKKTGRSIWRSHIIANVASFYAAI